MKQIFFFLLACVLSHANAQVAGKKITNTDEQFKSLSMPEKMAVMKQMSPLVLKQQADSICLAHKLVLKDAKGEPVNISQAIADNKLLIENGVVFYLPNGIPSPLVKKEHIQQNTKN